MAENVYDLIKPEPQGTTIEYPAERALAKVNQDMGMGYVPDPHEMLKIGEAINNILGHVERSTEATSKLVASQYQLNKALEDQQARLAIIEDRLREAGDHIPKEEREKATAKLANKIAKKSMDVRNYAGAKRAMTISEFNRQNKVEIFWEGESHILNIEGVRIQVNQGHNVLPEAAASVLRMRMNKQHESKDVENILRTGRRPGQKRDVLSTDEVNYYMKQVAKKYRGTDDLSPREMDEVMDFGVSALEEKIHNG